MSVLDGRLQISHNFDQRGRQSFSRLRDSSGKLYHTRDATWMRKQVHRQFQHSSLLAFDIEQDVRWSGEKMARGVAYHSERKQRNAVGRAGTCDEFRLHIHGSRSRCERKLVSLLSGMDQRRDSQKIRNVNRQAWKRRKRLTQIHCREILCQKKVADLRIIAERPCKPGTDQIVKMLVLQKFSQSLPANLFSNTGMKDLNRSMTDLATNYPGGIALDASLVCQMAQELCAFRY